ncbi:hypothetical protein TEA_000874 [Camellia sinensis var. sinensis]|uniref:Uncharacterized protein n=1 Tax=Camellia sinensis var. sinensis TaxID=542762 RepID=A0A4V3WRD5_CAMSN|nr:hypothetical protein TEA_000874 [Camellia sinensis var. sinensis]
MGRAPCCEKVGLKRGRWTAEEDEILTKYIQANGEGSWRSMPKNAGLLRCGKSCRLRWINYLRSDLKRGNISSEEEEIITKLHSTLGNSLNLPMGRKKRNLPPHSKPPPTEDRAAVDGGASSSVNLSDDLSQEQSKIDPHSPGPDAIKLECVRAINAIERGNHAKALRILKDLCLRHEDSPFVHRVEGYAHCQLASLIDDNVTKLRHLQNAVDSARRAVSLSPNSLEYATFYANLLYRLSCDDNSYEEAARECERALSIENPIDPGREMVVAASQLNVSTVEERIANTRDSLQILVQKCRIASSSSTLTENLETRRPNVIQKVVKTVEERRREIEVQVAMQQNLESMQTGLDLNSENTKHDDRRKYASLMKMMPSLKRMDEFKSYWNSMSVEKKRGLLELRIRDLRDHFSSFKDGLATKAFSEAIGFAQKNKTWKFSSCFFCGDQSRPPQIVSPPFGIIDIVESHVQSNTTLSVIERIPDMFSVLASKPGIRISDLDRGLKNDIRVLKRIVEHIVSIHKPSNYQAYPCALRLFYRLRNDCPIEVGSRVESKESPGSMAQDRVDHANPTGGDRGVEAL